MVCFASHGNSGDFWELSRNYSAFTRIALSRVVVSANPDDTAQYIYFELNSFGTYCLCKPSKGAAPPQYCMRLRSRADLVSLLGYWQLCDFRVCPVLGLDADQHAPTLSRKAGVEIFNFWSGATKRHPKSPPIPSHPPRQHGKIQSAVQTHSEL